MISNNYFHSDLSNKCFALAVILELIILIKVSHYLKNKKNIAYLITIIFEQFIIFAVWKHAIVSSAPYHLGIFLFFGICILPTICIVSPKYDKSYKI